MRLRYTFRDPALLERALTRKAFANEQRQKNIPCEDQEIFRTLGDSVIRLALTEFLVQDGAASRDEITQRRKELEREETLARIGRSLDLGSGIRLGVGEEKQNGRNEPYILAETLEAVTGAIFLDGGYDAAAGCIRIWFRGISPASGHEGAGSVLRSRE